MSQTKDCACAPQASPRCAIDIHISSGGDVNIYNCSAPGASTPPAPPPPATDTCPAQAAGACVPLALGAKPKQSRRRKIDRLLAGNHVPSALAASFFHTARRYLDGRSAGNALETDAFARLDKLSPALRGVLRCSLASFDSLPRSDLDRLADAGLRADLARPVDVPTLASALGAELLQRAGLLAFGDAAALEAERPGLTRVYDPGNAEDFTSQVNICRVNGLRTATYQPPLPLGQFTPAELQQRCVPTMQNGQLVQNCAVQGEPCPGYTIDATCLRVPEVEAGSAVLLEGVNFFDINAQVRILARAPATGEQRVDAHVVGDTQTPLTEVVDGQTRTIRDCRVQDRLSFKLPDDLAPGPYEIAVVVPNTTGIARLGTELISGPQFITVVPPATARFQIATERLRARAETSPASFGSDEVGLRFIAIPLLPDGNPGASQLADARFGDVDSGESRTMERVLFTHAQPIAGVALSITGYEIDGEDEYEQQIEAFSEVFIDIVRAQWNMVKEAIAALGGYAILKGLGFKVYIALAIAAAVTLAIDFFYSLWAPADLIVDDAIGLSTVDLAALTSLNFPLLPVAERTTERDIRIVTRNQEKAAATYRETREYISEDEDSRYEIRFRYNRLA